MNTNRVWYAPRAKITSSDYVHQVLMFGNLSEIKHLKKQLGEPALKKIFLHYPKKIYTDSAFNFVKNYILDIQTAIDEQKYLKYTPRVAR